MGRGRDQRLGQAAAANAQFGLDQASQGLQSTERALGRAETMLGTDEQIAGFNVSEDALKYTQRFAYNPAGLNTASGGNWGSNLGFVAQQANSLLAQAEAAYKAGDQAKAESLYQQAIATPGNSQARPQGSFSSIYDQSFVLTNTGESYEDAMARQLVSGPMAQSVGTIVREGRQLLDPNSATTQRYRDDLQKGATDALTTGRTNTLGAIDTAQTEANTAIDIARRRELAQVAVEGESARRMVRDLGMQRGSARSLGGEQAMYGRFASDAARMGGEVESKAAEATAKVASEAGSQRANAEMFYAQQQSALLKETEQFFTQFRADYTTNAPLMAEAFLQNRAGVRDSYMNRLQQMQLAIADTGRFLAETYLQSAAQQTQERLGRMQAQTQMMGSLISLGGNILQGLTTGIGFAMGA